MKTKKVLLIAASVALTMTATGISFAAPAEEADIAGYVYMNIPYGSFFAGEYEGGENIDAVSSATKRKSGEAGIVGGSYHTEDNSQVLGVAYPVAVTEGVELDASLEVADMDVLFESTDYAYVVLTEAPEFYKVLTIEDGEYVFSAAVGEVEDTPYENASLNTESRWGDYELMIQGTPDMVVAAGLLKTAEGNSYGVRTLENIWRGFEIGINTNDPSAANPGSLVSWEPYADLPGQTITEVVYFTQSGIKSFAVDLYVPVKISTTITVDPANINDGQTKVTLEGYPEDFVPEYTITGNGKDMACDGETITWSSALAGTYTLTVSDASGVYVASSQEFVLSTDNTAAAAGTEAVVKAEGATDEEFEAYINAITGYTVGEQEVGVFGFGAAQLILGDGTVDKTRSSVFSEIGDYEVVVHSAGSEDVTVSVHIDEVAEDESAGSQGGPGGSEGGESGGPEGEAKGASEGGEGRSEGAPAE